MTVLAQERSDEGLNLDRGGENKKKDSCKNYCRSKINSD